MRALYGLAVLAGGLMLAACAVVPPAGPSIAAMPPKDKGLDVFQQDDLTCRQYASQSIGFGSPQEAANQSAANSAVAGTLLGAAAGAAIGAAAGNPAAGAAIGAGSGLLLGSAAGADVAQYSASQLQYRYDVSYMQCMASRGNDVPQMAAAPYGAYPYAPYPYAYPYAAAYPGYYPYFYPYPGFFGATFAFGHRHHHHCC